MTCMIVAELSANHLGSVDRAMALIDAAKASGADAVKFQTYTPEQMCPANVVLTSGPWKGTTLLDLYKQAHTPRKWHPALFSYAKELGIEAFSSVFHPDDVDFLETLDCPRYKIASFELLDIPLIQRVAATGKPIIISTGMASEQEIHNALEAVTAYGSSQVTLLKCTSAYPSDARDANLRTLEDMRLCFCGNVGLSDHTQGIGVAVAAVALGATTIEKHLTLNRLDGGPDAEFSMEPHEFSQMVKECRRAEAAIGTVKYGPTASEASSLPLRRAPGGKRGV